MGIHLKTAQLAPTSLSREIREYHCLIMWLAEMVKLRLGGIFQSDKNCSPPPLKGVESVKDAPSPDDDFHGLEAGQWPGHVPRPGYLGVGLSYVSLALCVAGIVTLHRCTIVEKEQKLVTLLVSLVMITAGIVVFILANTIFKKEQRELTDHLKSQMRTNATKTLL